MNNLAALRDMLRAQPLTDDELYERSCSVAHSAIRQTRSTDEAIFQTYLNTTGATDLRSYVVAGDEEATREAIADLLRTRRQRIEDLTDDDIAALDRADSRALAQEAEGWLV